MINLVRLAYAAYRRGFASRARTEVTPVTSTIHTPVRGYTDPLAPIRLAIGNVGRRRPLNGIVSTLTVEDPTGWIPATALTDGSRIDELIDAAAHRWNAAPHVAAALAWKAYSYWAALPAVLGWAAVRRVPLMRPEDILVHLGDHRPVVQIGLRPGIRVAVLPGDPIWGLTDPDALALAPDKDALLTALRTSLLDAHLTPMIDALRSRSRISARTLLGSVASGVAYGVIDGSATLADQTRRDIATLLNTLGVSDLVEVNAGAGGLSVQRKTCCLAFTLPEPKVCSGCCLRR